MADLTNQLSAINQILAFVGQAPVNTLTNARADVQIATNILTQVSRTVQTEGWNFNVEYNVPLTPDGDGLITLPTNTIRFDLDPQYRSQVRVAIRDGKLRDVKNRTDVFTVSELKGTITYLLDFEDLPEAVKHYITVQAGIDFKSATVGAEAVNQRDLLKLQTAKVQAMRDDHDSANYTIFDNNPAINRDSRYRRWNF